MTRISSEIHRCKYIKGNNMFFSTSLKQYIMKSKIAWILKINHAWKKICFIY